MDLSIDKRMMGLQQIAVEKLQNILCRIPGKKDLIISPDLIKPLELICGATFLRSKGINKIYKFEQSQITVEPVDQHIIFFIRSDVEIFKQDTGQKTTMESVTIENTEFSVDDDRESFNLNGVYSIKTYTNPESLDKLKRPLEGYTNPDFHAKNVFMRGNILYNTKTPEIDQMIDLIIKCTYEEKLPEEVEKISGKRDQILSGTICPTKEIIGKYKNKNFILYGRYIFGFDQSFVTFKSVDFTGEKPKVNEDDKDHLLKNNFIVLQDVDFEKMYDEFGHVAFCEYNYAWAIVDDTNTLEAFAIYR